jgi:hypothetical protein
MPYWYVIFFAGSLFHNDEPHVVALLTKPCCSFEIPWEVVLKIYVNHVWMMFDWLFICWNFDWYWLMSMWMMSTAILKPLYCF